MRERALVPTLVLVALMVSLVSSLGAPLVPSIATADHVSLASAQWSLTLTLLVGAIATPVVGRLGDGPRRRPLLLGVVAAVLLGLVLAALPFGFVALLVGRGLMGLGLALIPLVIAIARDHLPPEQGRSAVALLAVTGVAGVGLGYPVTGVVAEHTGLHGAFWFGTVLAALALACAAVVIPHAPARTPARLDVVGAVLVGAGFAILLYGLANSATWGWGSPRLLGLVAASVVLLAVWAVHELRTEHPLIDLRLLRHRPVLLADLTAMLSGIGLYLTLSLCIRLVQTPTSTGYGIGASVAVGGLALLPMSLASVSTSRMVPLLTRHLPADRLLPLGTVVFGLGIGLFALNRGSLVAIMAVLAVVGLGVGVVASIMPALILRSVPPTEMGSATAFNQVLRNAGYAAGSALSATILEAHTPSGQALPTDSGYQSAAYVALALCAFTLVVIVPLLPRREKLAKGLDSSTDRLLREEALADSLSEHDTDLVRPLAR